MTDVRVLPLEEGAFGVEVTEGDETTNHRVTIPAGYLDDLGVAGTDPQDVVREAFGFLLEREPATSILRDFALGEIEGYFPEFRDELPRRLGR